MRDVRIALLMFIFGPSRRRFELGGLPFSMTTGGQKTLPFYRSRQDKHCARSQAPENRLAAGLHYRSLADTASSTLEWCHSQPEECRANSRRWPTPGQERAAILDMFGLDTRGALNGRARSNGHSKSGAHVLR